MENKILGGNIKKFRKLKSMTQSDLAKLLSVSDKTISSWEINRTEPSIGYIEKMCTIFQCKKTDLLGKDFGWEHDACNSEEQTNDEKNKINTFESALYKGTELSRRIEKLNLLPDYLREYIFNLIDNSYELYIHSKGDNNQ
jgi:transcriptional regulator with XRE-family HTH domain